jgi:hypothetical protein
MYEYCLQVNNYKYGDDAELWGYRFTLWSTVLFREISLSSDRSGVESVLQSNPMTTYTWAKHANASQISF